MTNGGVNIKDSKTGEVINIKKLVIQIPIGKLYNDLIKSPPEGIFDGSRPESDGVIIGDT